MADKTRRTTISIPANLKRRMDSFSERPVNWSQLACGAFHRFLDDPEHCGVPDIHSLVGRVEAIERKINPYPIEQWPDSTRTD